MTDDQFAALMDMLSAIRLDLQLIGSAVCALLGVALILVFGSGWRSGK